jgi:hypothetical protein
MRGPEDRVSTLLVLLIDSALAAAVGERVGDQRRSRGDTGVGAGQLLVFRRRRVAKYSIVLRNPLY